MEAESRYVERQGVVGDGMIRKVMCVKQGDLYEEENRAGVRADIVAMKRGNSRGAKGGRKVDMEGKTNGNKPSLVSERTKQEGDTQAKGLRVEPFAWTDHMLTALNKKGERIKIFAESRLFSLCTAWEEAS